MLWNDITGWLHKPFQEPQDLGNWVLVLIIGTTIAYGWSRVLIHVLEE
jgi:hypothetical protein